MVPISSRTLTKQSIEIMIKNSMLVKYIVKMV